MHSSNGISVEQDLLNLDKFKSNYFSGKLIGYNFGSSICIGEDERGNPIKRMMKEQMTKLISDLLYKKKLKFPVQDKEIENQFCSHSFIIKEKHKVYKKANDHIIDATRCAVMRKFHENESEHNSSDIITITNCPIATFDSPPTSQREMDERYKKQQLDILLPKK